MRLHGPRFATLDALPLRDVRMYAWTIPSFQLCGCTGLALAIVLATILTVHLDLSLWILTCIVLCAVLTFLSLVMVTKIITGEEQIIYYHHEIAVMIAVAVVLRVLHQDVMPYLDVTLLGIGTFLFCGRVGCFMVGCCHGRPYHWGVCYREDHAEAGFTRHYVGVRLFPVQLLESFCVFCIVTVGCVLVVSRPPGEALAWYVFSYGIMRFCLEFMRGDPDRPYHAGFSEAQWISLILMCSVLWAELKGVGAFHPWHAAATTGLAMTLAVVALSRGHGRTARHKLLNPRHVREVAEALELVSESADNQVPVSTWNPVPSAVQTVRTSLGIQISSGRVQTPAGFTRHYALSCQKEVMTEKTAQILARLILQLKHRDAPNDLVTGNSGVFHLMIDPRRKGRTRTLPASIAFKGAFGHGV